MATPKKPSKSAGGVKAKAADKPAQLAPVVNLSQAAHSAAALLAARRKRANSDDAAAGKAGMSAAALQKLKDGLAQPQHAATSPLAGLNKQPRSAGVSGYNRVGGHHQNPNANVARTGVPRRTSGG